MRYQERADAARLVTPSAYLRRKGIRSRTFGVLLLGLTVMGALGLVLDSSPRTVENIVLMVVEIVFGLLFLADSAIVLAAAPRFPEVARQARLLRNTRLTAVIFSAGASGILLLLALIDVARRPALFDAALAPLGVLLVYLLVRSPLKDALRYGPPGTRVVTPDEYLRQSARVFGGSGAFLVALVGALWVYYAVHGQPLAAYESLFLRLLGAFALLLGGQGVIAVRAAPRFPAVDDLARTNFVVGVAAMALGVGGTVALVILGAWESPYVAIVSVAVVGLILRNSWALRWFLHGLAAKVLSQG